MNILIINHYAGSDQHGMEFRPYYLAKNWISQGHNVKIIASSFSHLRKVNPQFEGKFLEENIDDIKYFWIKTKSYMGNNYKRVLNIFEFLFKLYKYRKMILKNFIPDIVIASSTYPIDNLIAHRFAKKYKAIHIYEVHDLWPMSLIQIGKMNKKHPFVRLIQYFENYSYRKADCIVSLLSNSKEHMINHGMNSNKFIFIPNGCVNKKNNHSKLSEYSLKIINDVETMKKKYFVIGYAGGHSISNALDTFIEVANKVNNLKVKFVLIGDGIEKQRLQDLVKKKNVSFYNKINKNDVIPVLKHFNCLYIGWKNINLYNNGISPNKLIDYMYSGRPILHSVVNQETDLVVKANCGFTTKADDVRSIISTIHEILNTSEEKLNQMGKNGQRYVEENLTYAKLSRDFINSVIDKRRKL